MTTARSSLAFALLLMLGCAGASSGGIPDGCEVRFEGQCYASATEACAAAECPAPRCLILESYPGQVQCEPERAGRP